MKSLTLTISLLFMSVLQVISMDVIASETEGEEEAWRVATEVNKKVTSSITQVDLFRVITISRLEENYFSFKIGSTPLITEEQIVKEINTASVIAQMLKVEITNLRKELETLVSSIISGDLDLPPECAQVLVHGISEVVDYLSQMEGKLAFISSALVEMGSRIKRGKIDGNAGADGALNSVKSAVKSLEEISNEILKVTREMVKVITKKLKEACEKCPPEDLSPLCQSLDVKLDFFDATLNSAEEASLTWEIVEGNNVYLNVWIAQIEANEFRDITKLNDRPILLDGKTSLMNLSLETKELNLGVNYFALESINYNGECETHCDYIDAVVLGKEEIALEFAKRLCKREVKRQNIAFGNTGSCIE